MHAFVLGKEEVLVGKRGRVGRKEREGWSKRRED
jgi:hypothetical protein